MKKFLKLLMIVILILAILAGAGCLVLGKYVQAYFLWRNIEKNEDFGISVEYMYSHSDEMNGVFIDILSEKGNIDIEKNGEKYHIVLENDNAISYELYGENGNYIVKLMDVVDSYLIPKFNLDLKFPLNLVYLSLENKYIDIKYMLGLLESIMGGIPRIKLVSSEFGYHGFDKLEDFSYGSAFFIKVYDTDGLQLYVAPAGRNAVNIRAIFNGAILDMKAVFDFSVKKQLQVPESLITDEMIKSQNR